MMDFELKLERPNTPRAFISALTMGLANFIGKARSLHPREYSTHSSMLGGLIPMIPYFAVEEVTSGLYISIGVTAVILLIVGYLKCAITSSTGRRSLWGALQTLCIGSAAAGTSYGIVRAIDSTKSVAVGS